MKNVAIGITLVVVGIGLLLALRGRNRPAVIDCFTQLRQIDAAKQNWALAKSVSSNAVPTWDDLRSYVPSGRLEHEVPHCPEGGVYTLGPVAERPRCSHPGHDLDRGVVQVADESGLPVEGATVMVMTNSSKAYVATTPNHGALRVCTYSGIQSLAVSKAGYVTQSIPVPRNWPLRVTLKRESQ